MKNETIGWHFVGDTLRDGRPVPRDGVWLRHDGPVTICENGLHYGITPWDALQCAPGNTLCMVAVRDIGETENDKGVARERKIICRMEATELLRYFARKQALSVIHLWTECPPDCVLDYLMGDDSQRSAAYSAARSAAISAARDEFNSIVHECFGVSP